MPWRYLHIGPENDDVQYDDVKLWSHEWKKQGEVPITANHPQHSSELHRLNRFFVQADGKLVEFAAAEVSAGVWLFWVPAARGAARQLAFTIFAYGLVAAGTFIGLHGWSTDPLRYSFLGAVLVLLGFGAEKWFKSRRASSDA